MAWRTVRGRMKQGQHASSRGAPRRYFPRMLRQTVATVSAPTVWMSQMLGSGTKVGALQLAFHAPSLTLRRGNRIVPSIKAEVRRG